MPYLSSCKAGDWRGRARLGECLARWNRICKIRRKAFSLELQWTSSAVLASRSALGSPKVSVCCGRRVERDVEGGDVSDGWTGSKERTVSINSGRPVQTRSKNEWKVGEDCVMCSGEEEGVQGLELSTRNRSLRSDLGFCHSVKTWQGKSFSCVSSRTGRGRRGGIRFLTPSVTPSIWRRISLVSMSRKHAFLKAQPDFTFYSL